MSGRCGGTTVARRSRTPSTPATSASSGAARRRRAKPSSAAARCCPRWSAGSTSWTGTSSRTSAWCARRRSGPSAWRERGFRYADPGDIEGDIEKRFTDDRRRRGTTRGRPRRRIPARAMTAPPLTRCRRDEISRRERRPRVREARDHSGRAGRAPAVRRRVPQTEPQAARAGQTARRISRRKFVAHHAATRSYIGLRASLARVPMDSQRSPRALRREGQGGPNVQPGDPLSSCCCPCRSRVPGRARRAGRRRCGDAARGLPADDRDHRPRVPDGRRGDAERPCVRCREERHREDVPSLTDPTPEIAADLRTQVHNFSARGLMSVARRPQLPDAAVHLRLLHA